MNKAENLTFESHDYNLQPPPDVVAFNELRSCADLFRLYKEKTLEIQPFFQREVVWKKTEQTRFIDSLIKQLPIPSMCFSLNYKTQRWQVVDGLQRMTAIVSFLGSNDWRLSRLDDIDSRISGRTSKELKEGPDDLNLLYRRVENLSLPVTVIRCDYEKSDHVNYLFTIFHRLNAGGVRLNNQEIRNCIFSGTFNELLRELDSSENWQAIKTRLPSQGKRFRSVELILRFFAFEKSTESYRGNFSKFLNDFMHSNRNQTNEQIVAFRNLFEQTIDVINKLLQSPLMAKPSYTLLETLMVGVASNINSLRSLGYEGLNSRLKDLLGDPSLSREALKADISRTEKVQQRLSAARQILK